MSKYTATVRSSYIELRGLNLGMEFVKEHSLRAGQKYSVVIQGIDDADIEGTLDKSGFIGGLSLLYKEFDLSVGDLVSIDYNEPLIVILPPADKRRNRPVDPGTIEHVQQPDTILVFEQQKLRHLYIEPFSPGNLTRWTPQSEPDVYMVFGVLSEYTDFRYCCGTSKSLLSRLGYTGDTKPDAILIERTTGQYVVAEFKMTSKEFTLNHSREEIDVLVCWDDDETDRTKLPPKVLGLRGLLEKAVKQGDIDL